ncbi:hypothetical protein FOZ62_009522, partial [Perkinsus olseni]
QTHDPLEQAGSFGGPSIAQRTFLRTREAQAAGTVGGPLELLQQLGEDPTGARKRKSRMRVRYPEPGYSEARSLMIQRSLVKQIQAERRALNLERRRQRDAQASLARQRLKEIEEQEKRADEGASCPHPLVATMTVDNRLQLLGTHNSPVVSPVYGDSGDLYVIGEEGCGEIFRYMGIDDLQHPDVSGEPDPSTEIRIAPCGPFGPLDAGCTGFVIQSPPEREQGSSAVIAVTACDMANGTLVKVTRTLGDSGAVPSGEVGKVNSEALMVPMDLG